MEISFTNRNGDTLVIKKPLENGPAILSIVTKDEGTISTELWADERAKLVKALEVF